MGLDVGTGGWQGGQEKQTLSNATTCRGGKGPGLPSSKEITASQAAKRAKKSRLQSQHNSSLSLSVRSRIPAASARANFPKISLSPPVMVCSFLSWGQNRSPPPWLRQRRSPSAQQRSAPRCRSVRRLDLPNFMASRGCREDPQPFIDTRESTLPPIHPPKSFTTIPGSHCRPSAPPFHPRRVPLAFRRGSRCPIPSTLTPNRVSLT